MLYIAATVEDLSSWEGLKHFSKSALAAIIDWHDEQEIDQEADAAELRGEWTEYESASELWRCNRQVDFNLPHLYDPDQLEDLVTAMESRGYNIIETEAGWLVKEASPASTGEAPSGAFPLARCLSRLYSSPERMSAQQTQSIFRATAQTA